MSRCFPFPPPGYVGNGARSEALIESIKLQREIEKAKKDRKKEKKEKKEKKRENKEKKERRKEKKERKHKEGSTFLASDGKKFKLIDEPKEIRADGKLQKAEDYENEQFERSGITEEHDQPVSSREHCCLSDSTQSSSKRKRSASPSSQDQGPAIKIRLPLRKHREPEESKPESQVESSGRVGIADSSTRDSRGGNHQLQQALVTNAEANHFHGKSDSRHCKQAQNLAHGDAQVTNKIPDDETGRMAYLYNSLFQNPLGCEVFNSEDDQDWLFRPQRSEPKPALKKVESDTDAFRCSTSSLWPRAQYFPEVDIYALPYTVPF